MAENRHLEMGSLSYEPRGNLSLFIQVNYRLNTLIYQEYSGFREVIPRQICPFCPVIFGSKLHNSLRV